MPLLVSADTAAEFVGIRPRTLLAAAGLPRVTLHDLRHSTATMLLTAGVPLPVVSRILGHANVRITMDLYVGRIPELQREAAERLQEALG